MASSEETSTLAETVTEVLEAHPIRLGLLFGSHVRGDSGPHSDVDVAVEFEEWLDEDARRRVLLDLITDLSRALRTDDIDVTDLDGVRPAVGAAALTDGRLLVGSRERRNTLREQFRTETPRRSREEVMNRFDELLNRIEEHA